MVTRYGTTDPRSSAGGTGPPDGRRPEPADRPESLPDASRFVLVGGGQVGRVLAERLADRWEVHHLDTEPAAVADPAAHEATHATDLTTISALAAAEVTDADTVVVLTGDDGRSLLVTQLLRTAFDVGRIYVVLGDPRNGEAFDIPGVEVVCTAEVLSAAVLAAFGGDRSQAPAVPTSTVTGTDSTVTGTDSAGDRRRPADRG